MSMDDRLGQARNNYRDLVPPETPRVEPRPGGVRHGAPRASAIHTAAYVAAEVDSFGGTQWGADRLELVHSRRQFHLALGLSLIALMAIALVANRHNGPGTETADGTTTTTSVDLTVPTTARLNELRLPDVITPLGPTDGKASARLPVQVRPDKDLVPGQMVSVTGLGFRPNTSVGAVMCTNAATTEGATGCDIGNVVNIVDSDANGVATLEYEMRRFIQVGNQTIDCLKGNVNPDDWAQLVREQGPKPTVPINPNSFTCVIAMGEVADYDHSGGWPIAFAGSSYLLPTTTLPLATTTVATTAPPTAVAVPTTPGPTTVAVPTTPAPTTAVPTTPAPATTTTTERTAPTTASTASIP